ncbi:M20/M25/M40 family metallo-hydrolase [candidate division TA06 bacterium]|nr:M20/M25/M40 family metallo-hydrolase [candidate division TA06 bacterium]
MLNAHQILKELNFERLAGSANETKAIKIITKYLGQLKVKHQLEPFQLHAFDTGTASISCGGKTFKAHPFGLTKSQIISGELVYLEDLEVLTNDRGSYKDKIILTYSYGRKLVEAIKRSGAKALIDIGSPQREAPSWSYRQKNYEEGYIPSATVSYEDGAKLAGLSGKKAILKIKQTVSRRTARNIIVDIKGTGKDRTLTLAVGHYDSVARSPGSCDNGGGVVSLLKAVEHFSKNPPARDLRVIFFSGEEMGLRGSFSYVEKHKKEIAERAGLVVNIDVGGDDLGLNHFEVLGTAQLQGYVCGITREIGHYFRSAVDIYSSDCMPFSVYEVPSVNISREGGQSSFNIHTPGDTVEYTSARGLQPTIEAGINLLDRALNAKIYPVNKEIDRTLKDKIEKYLWNALQVPPEMKWAPEYKK